MYAVIFDGIVTQISSIKFDAHPSILFVKIEDNLPVSLGWGWDGQSFSPPLASPEPTMEEMQAAFVSAIQAHLDAFAQTRNYDGIMSAATYAISTIPKFAAEGQYAVEARDATWSKGYEILGQISTGQRPAPTVEEVIAELPPLAWPV